MNPDQKKGLRAVVCLIAAMLFANSPVLAQGVFDHSDVFWVPGKIFEDCPAGVFDGESSTFKIFDDLEPETVPICLITHEDSDADGPHGAVKILAKDLPDLLPDSASYLFSIADLTVYGLDHVLINMYSESMVSGERMFEQIASLRVGKEVASSKIKDTTTTVDCILVDNNTVVCIIVTGQRVHVLVLCRENGRWRACQNDSQPLVPN